jgi:hypothetical protein
MVFSKEGLLVLPWDLEFSYQLYGFGLVDLS